jgi:hypothetical protein
VSLPRGYNEAGAEWLEPWCDEHPDLDGQGCVACIGASHDAWMHRAKAAEAEVARLREALTRAADYDIRVTAGASDAYVIQDIAREAVGWSEALEAGER